MARKFEIRMKSMLLCYCLMASTVTNIMASTEYNRYLGYLFQKYGSGGHITFEGLEHLMHNLGLGQIEFEPTHTIEEHRPNGFNNIDNTNNDENLKNYLDQETKKFLSNDEDNLHISYGALPRRSETEASTSIKLNTKQNPSVVWFEFKEMHDPKHRHPRENVIANDALIFNSPNMCLSPKSLMQLVVDHNDLHNPKLYKTFVDKSKKDANHQEEHDVDSEYNNFINNVKLTPLAFMKLCPALLAQVDQQVCMKPAPLTNGQTQQEMIWNAWIYASAAIFVLSACGLLGLLIVPLMKTAIWQTVLNFLIAIAVGTLSADATMHLLPHALFTEHSSSSSSSDEKSTSHDEHNNRAVYICGCAFLTAIFMYTLESLLPLIKSETHAHGHSHGAQTAVETKTAAAASQLQTAAQTDDKENRELNVMLDELKQDQKGISKALTPVAFMVVIGDGLHNLTDGLAIGAAFATDPVTGLATAFAVLCHELPHELGDFALLLQTGVSLRRTLYLNLVSSILSFLGMAFGLFIAGSHASITPWIYAGTAGSFLYIAFADLIPAMAAVEKRTLQTVLTQILGILLGGLIMLLIAVNEEQLEKLFE